MYKKCIVASIALLNLLVFSSVGVCEMPSGKGGGKLSHLSMMLSTKLQLTDDQKTQIDKLTLEADKKNIQLSADLEISQMELQSLLAKDELDQKEISKKIDKAAEISASVQKNNFACLIDIQKILTPDQKKTYKEIFKLMALKVGNKSERGMSGGMHSGKMGSPEGEMRGPKPGFEGDKQKPQGNFEGDKKGPQGNFEGERKNLQQGSQQGAPQGNSASSGASDEEILNLLLAE
ncbi:MAG: periplasmic heavy metal sensor [Candidatus Firestonebacteria bacterium]